MAVSAKFIADLSSFRAEFDKTEVKVANLRAETDRAARQLTRMENSFNGKKIFADAELATKAIKGLEGVSTLTAAEQVRLNGIVTQALDKYKALGQEAPKHLQAIADATKPIPKTLTDVATATTPVNSGFKSILSTLKQIGPAIGISFSVGAVVGFAKSVGAFAGQMLDLEAQTQITTKRLQAFNFAGAGVGLTIENITTSADQLAKRLGGDDASVERALEKLNLKGQELEQLGLDEVMFRIDESLVKVGNQFDRARILSDLFGRSGAQLGRLMDGSLRQVIKSAEESGAVIDRELLKKADEFDDAWAQAWIKFRAYAVTGVEGARAAMQSLFSLSTLPKAVAAFLAQPNAGAGGNIPLAELMVQLGLGRGGTTAGKGPIGPAFPFESIVEGAGIKGVIEESGIAKELRDWASKTHEAADATASWARNLQGEFLMKMDAQRMAANAMSAEIIFGRSQNQLLIPGTNIDPRLLMTGPGRISQSGSAGFGLLSGGTSIGGSLRNVLGGLPDVILGALQGGGNITKSIGSLLGGSLLGSGTGLNKALSGGIGKLLGNTVGGLAGSILPGIGALLGPAISGITKLFGSLFGAEGKKTNRARDAAISEFTGITGDKGASQEKFRELALAAGVANAEIDRLFSTKRTKDFESAMDAVTAKINAFTSDQEADQARLTAAIEKYGLTFEQLGPAFQKQRLDEQAKELIEDWRVLIGAGVEITDVNNAMAEAVNEYLRTAVKLGTEVPSAMRPVLQKMLEQGTLTDEAGNAITDMESAGIKFSETMTEGFEKVVKKLDELIDKIGLANIELGKMPAVPEPPSSLWTWDPDETGPVVPAPGFAQGTRGRFLDFGRGTPVMLHGRERVQTEAEGRAESGGWSYVGDRVDALGQQLQRLTEGLQRGMRDQMAIAIGRTA